MFRTVSGVCLGTDCCERCVHVDTEVKGSSVSAMTSHSVKRHKLWHTHRNRVEIPKSSSCTVWCNPIIAPGSSTACPAGAQGFPTLRKIVLIAPSMPGVQASIRAVPPLLGCTGREALSATFKSAGQIRRANSLSAHPLPPRYNLQPALCFYPLHLCSISLSQHEACDGAGPG